MQRLGQQFLTGTAFAEEQHRDVRRCDLLDRAQHRHHLRTARNDTLHRQGLACLGEADNFSLELEELSRPVDNQRKDFRLDRLLVKIVSAELDGTQRMRPIFLAGSNDYLGRW
jgi:hypothetical protein